MRKVAIKNQQQDQKSTPQNCNSKGMVKVCLDENFHASSNVNVPDQLVFSLILSMTGKRNFQTSRAILHPLNFQEFQAILDRNKR